MSVDQMEVCKMSEVAQVSEQWERGKCNKENGSGSQEGRLESPPMLTKLQGHVSGVDLLLVANNIPLHSLSSKPRHPLHHPSCIYIIYIIYIYIYSIEGVGKK